MFKFDLLLSSEQTKSCSTLTLTCVNPTKTSRSTETRVTTVSTSVAWASTSSTRPLRSWVRPSLTPVTITCALLHFSGIPVSQPIRARRDVPQLQQVLDVCSEGLLVRSARPSANALACVRTVQVAVGCFRLRFGTKPVDVRTPKSLLMKSSVVFRVRASRVGAGLRRRVRHFVMSHVTKLRTEFTCTHAMCLIICTRYYMCTHSIRPCSSAQNALSHSQLLRILPRLPVFVSKGHVFVLYITVIVLDYFFSRMCCILFCSRSARLRLLVCVFRRFLLLSVLWSFAKLEVLKLEIPDRTCNMWFRTVC